MKSLPPTHQDLILVVDDDPTLRMLVRAALEQAGYVVEEATDGWQALQQFIRHKPAAIMMDVDMPGMNGFDACIRIREDAVGAHIPILMVTGLEDVESVNRAYAVGATDFIPKPINWALLAHRIRYVLRASGTYQELRASEAKNTALLSAIPDTLLVTRRDGTILDFVSGRGSILLKEPRGDQQTIHAYLPVKQAERWNSLIREVAATGELSRGEFWLDENDERHHYEMQLVPYLNDLALTIIRDIAERKRAEDRVHRLAYFDTLTGLPNRQLFHQKLQHAIDEASEKKLKVATLYVDLDNFKRINDTLGHNFGDVVLKEVANRIEHCVRSYDSVVRAGPDDDGPQLARLGGDEFVAILHNLQSEDEAVAVAERLRREFTRPVHHQGHEFVVTSSIGVSIYPDDGDDIDTLLKNADVAMYQAKNAGRNSVRFYSGTMSLRSLERLELESSLHHALERGEFDLHYQPKISIASGKICGVEALIRWNHPERGMIDPGSFIPVAEECGLISPIGEWVLKRACRQARLWQDRFGLDISVAVNLSSQQFLQSRVDEVVLQALFEASLKPRLLQLELTESILMHDMSETVPLLNKLKSMGIGLAMDDFGTGYSSLSYLKRLPIDIVKIDRTFVADLEQDRDDAAICATIIAMAHALGLQVVAEGVETEGQLEYLRAQGCDQVQGYLISKAVTASELEREFLAKGARHISSSA